MSTDYWWLVATVPADELDDLGPQFAEFSQRLLAQTQIDEALALWRDLDDIRLHMTAEMSEMVPDDRWGLRTIRTGERYPAWPPSPQIEQVYVDGQWMRGPTIYFDDAVHAIMSPFSVAWDPDEFWQAFQTLELDDRGRSWELFESNRVSTRRTMLLALGFVRAMQLPGHLGMYLLTPDEVVAGLPALEATLSLDEPERARFESTSQLLTSTYGSCSATLDDLSVLVSLHRRAGETGQALFSIECWT